VHASVGGARKRRRCTPEEYEVILAVAAEGTARTATCCLWVAQGDRKRLTLHMLDLRDVAGDAATGAPTSLAQGTNAEVDLTDPLPIRGDRLTLRLALVNVFDHAVADTPEGGTLRLSGRRDRHYVRVIVRGIGPGATPDHLPRLFEPFYRADASGGDDRGRAHRTHR